jgi:hypothetical protein
MTKLSDKDKGLAKVLNKLVGECLQRLRNAPRLLQNKSRVGYMDNEGNRYFVEIKVSKISNIPDQKSINQK